MTHAVRRPIQQFNHNGCSVRMELVLRRMDASEIFETVGIEVSINGRVVDSIDFVFDLTKISALLVTPEGTNLQLPLEENEGSLAP